MTKAEALEFVNAEIARIERENEGKELRPWEPDACAAAKEHWNRVQQRIFLETSGKRGPTHCCDEFTITNLRYHQKRWAKAEGGIKPP